MNSLEKIYEILSSLNLPVSYSDFKNSKNTKPSLPFISYYETDSDNLFADDSVYCENSNVIIELYTQNKNLELEKQVKNLLKSHKICYKTSNSDVPDENIHITYFYISTF